MTVNDVNGKSIIIRNSLTFMTHLFLIDMTIHFLIDTSTVKLTEVLEIKVSL